MTVDCYVEQTSCIQLSQICQRLHHYNKEFQMKASYAETQWGLSLFTPHKSTCWGNICAQHWVTKCPQYFL